MVLDGKVSISLGVEVWLVRFSIVWVDVDVRFSISLG